MWSVILLISFCGLVQGLSRVDPLVSTKSGLIRGLLTDSGYAQFLGVPYAEVNKSNPFGPANPHPGFNDIYEAYKSNVCPQVSYNTVVGTIDCLTLNIYVPSAATSKNRLPVMVWIHGGYFIVGSGDAVRIPDYLLRNDVIVVTINYRLGAYGFMCLDIPEVSGNQGLKDQVLALRWINDNIDAFGGDVTQITVFGESAGGMSVNLHLLSSYEPLFQKAIIQSGPAVSPWVMKETDNSVPIKLAEALNFPTDDVSEAIAFLSTIEVHTLVKLAHDLKLTFFMSLEDSPSTVPCVEKKMEGVEHFLTEYTMNVESTKLKNVPVILGVTSNELFMGYGTADNEFFRNFDFTVLNTAIDLGEKFDEAVEDIRHFYIGDEDTSEKVKDEITNFASDVLFNHPTERMAKRLLELGAKSVYRYVFSYSGGRNVIKIRLNLNGTGAVHADELGYLFDSGELTGDIAPEDQLMIDRMTTMWTNFAKYGDPTPSTSGLLPIKWEPITRTTHPYLNLDSDLNLESRPFHNRMAFWDLFYKVYVN
ncbi:bile salt-activated lipase-like [Spodoptera litura]|uniref:Carboxylic ester hydrolase n=1 Tax=Spodoptera litura TaxID=69820 RepID=A0A9J7DWX0_SPOLT|nr:bile salt-activated lipase-like [Spodoptera litura]